MPCPVMLRWVAVVLFVGLCVGCGKKASGTIEGSITYKGQPVRFGDVNIVAKSGIASLVNLNEAGEFRVTSPMLVDEYVVFLTPPNYEPPVPGQKPRATGTLVAPDKYRSPATSPLRVQLKAGVNQVQFELVD